MKSVALVPAYNGNLLNAIPGMIDRLVEDGYDIVLSRRNLRIYPFIKRFGNQLLSFHASLLSGFRYHDCELGLRGMRIAVVPEVLNDYRGYRYSDSQEITVITALKGFRIDNDYVCL